MKCPTCHDTGLVPAMPTKRWLVMDCPLCRPGESVEEQIARLRDKAARLQANIAHPAREVVR